MGWLKGRLIRLAALLFLPGLLACTTSTGTSPDIASIVPLYSEAEPGANVFPELQSRLETPDLLALTPEMKDFADRYIKPARGHRQRLKLLHSSLRSGALLDIDYRPDADGSAADVFNRGTANCLSYAHLFIAMGRYVGLNADYHMLTLRPEWSRHGNQVALRQHVNVLVKIGSFQEYMVDIDPVERADIAERRTISDREAASLHHNNIAMTALFDEDLEQAYGNSVTALQLSPNTDFLWINLGAIYSAAGNYSASETSYRSALSLNPFAASAMNNMMVLHERRGETEAAEYWESRIRIHRQRNPYYHVYLGQTALESGDSEKAISHYLDAINRKQDDSELYFQLGKLYQELGKPQQAKRYVMEAIERAYLLVQKEAYQEYLNGISEPSLASVSSAEPGLL